VAPGKRSTPPWEERSPFEVDDVAATAVVEVPRQAAEASAGETVYVPSQRLSAGAAAVAPEVRHLDDGRLALLVYSTLELLVAGCGKAQPWMAVRLERPGSVDELARLAGAEVVLRDVEVPVGLRHIGGEQGGKGARS
jgi:hypothetical protein